MPMAQSNSAADDTAPLSSRRPYNATHAAIPAPSETRASGRSASASPAPAVGTDTPDALRERESLLGLRAVDNDMNPCFVQ